MARDGRLPAAGRRVAQRERAATPGGGSRRRSRPPEPRPALRPATTRSRCCSSAATRRCPPPSQLALTLRAVGGLTTAEIASAFLVPEATMAQRISRAKQSIRSAGLPVRPATRAGAGRAAAASSCTCSTSSSTRATRRARGRPCSGRDLTTEAIRLARLLHQLAARRGRGRRPARADAADRRAPGGPDRRRRLARAARRAAARSLGLGPDRGRRGTGHPHPRARPRSARTSCRRRSPRCTTRQPTAEETDWPQILALYDVLEQVTPGPVVTLNRAVAVAMVHGPRAGLGRARHPRRRRADGAEPPARRGPRPPARAGGRHGRGPRRLPAGRAG